MNNILLEILSPEGLFLKKEVYMVTMPGFEGALGVCYGHLPMMVVINQGIATLYNQDNQPLEHFFIGSGFVEISRTSVTIMVEEASKLEDYSLDSLKEKLAELSKNNTQDEIDHKLNEKEIEKHKILLQFLSS